MISDRLLASTSPCPLTEVRHPCESDIPHMLFMECGQPTKDQGTDLLHSAMLECGNSLKHHWT